jgi:hypothetical protein
LIGLIGWRWRWRFGIRGMIWVRVTAPAGLAILKFEKCVSYFFTRKRNEISHISL